MSGVLLKETKMHPVIITTLLGGLMIPGGLGLLLLHDKMKGRRFGFLTMMLSWAVFVGAVFFSINLVWSSFAAPLL